MRGIIRIAILIFLITTSIKGQNVRIDSLQSLIQTSPHDTILVQALNELSWEFHRYDNARCFDYATDALTKARAINYLEGISRALNLRAIAYSLWGKDSLAIADNLAALEIARKIENKYLISVAVNDLGISYNEQGDHQAALTFYQESLKLAEEIDDELGICFSLGNIGALHQRLGNLGQAREYYLQSAEVGEKAQDTMVISMAYSRLGYTYLDDKKYEEALQYFSSAKEMAERIGDKDTQAGMLSALGFLKEEQKQYEAAEKFHKVSLELYQEMGSRRNLPFAYLNLAKALGKQEKTGKALQYIDVGLALSEEMKLRELTISYYETAASLYAQRKEHKKAYQFQQMMIVGRDSLFLTEQSGQIIEMEARYQSETKEAENQLLKEQQAKNKALIRQRTITNQAIILILILVSAFALTLFVAYRQKKSYNDTLEKEVKARTADMEATNQKLLESNQELERFAYIASHDLKEPLRNIVSFTRLIERRLMGNTDETISEYLGFVVNNAKQMHLLIEDVLEFSRLEKGVLFYEIIDVSELVVKLQQTLHTTFVERGAVLYAEELPTVKTDRTQLFIVLKNLVENGIKYNNNKEPRITISCEQQAEQYYFRIQDNGIGIEPSFHSQVFSMFKRLHNRAEYEGSGLGLSICKKIIQSMGGDIWIESPRAEQYKGKATGTTFVFSIPIVPLSEEQYSYETALAHNVGG